MKNIYLFLLLCSFTFSPLLAIAQVTDTTKDTNTEQTKTVETNKNGKIPVTQRDYENTEVTMADTFRNDGKIYVVVAVLTTIFAGIVVFLVVTESKLKKLEDLVYSGKNFKEKV